MGFLDLFGGDSSSTTTNKTEDNQIGASQGNAIRIETPTAPVTIGSDAVANNAITAIAATAKNVSDVFAAGLANLQTNIAKQQDTNSTAIAAAQQQSSSLASNATTTGSQAANDTFTHLVAIVGFVLVGYFFLKR